MADGYIDIDVRLNDSPAKSKANSIGRQIGKQISSSVDEAAKTADKSTNDALDGIGKSLSGYGSAMSKAVTIPILAAATATGAAAVKIDTALTGVRKTVDGTAEQYEELKQKAIDFSKTNAVDPAQILDIQALGAQLGYSISELDLFGETISGLSISTNMGAEEAAQELAHFANIMKMSHDETKNYGSTIVDLGNHFATTESDISQMALRIAGAGKQIGMSSADVLGMATALSSMGINAEAGGTAISTIMSNIDKSVAQGGEKLETWASVAKMSADEFAKAWQSDPVAALNSVLAGMDEATEQGGNINTILEELGVSAIRQTDVFKRLANNTEMLPKAIDTANRAWEENIALDKEVENRNASMAAQLQILWNKVQAVAIEVGEPLMMALIGVLDAAQPLIDMLASGAKAFSDLDEEGQKTVLMAIGIVAAIGPVTSGLGKLLTVTTKNDGAWSKFAGNLKVVKDGLLKSTNVANQSTASFGKYFAIQKDGVNTVYKVNRATGEYVQTNSKLAAALSTTSAGVKVQNAAIKTGTAAMNLAKGAARALGSAMLTIVPVAVIAGITAIVDGIRNVKESSEKTIKATQGLRDALGSYAKAYDDTANSFSNADEKAGYYTSTLGEVREASEKAMDSQAELSDKLTDLWSETGTNNAMVDEYLRIINDLTDGYDENGNAAKLSAEEQAKLQGAVDGLNRIMGTSYSVVDAENGVLNTNIDAINRSAQAWKDRALAEATAAAQADLMKQHIENQTALHKAEENLKVAQDELNAAMANGEEYLDVYNQNVKSAQEEVDRLNGADQDVIESMDEVNEIAQELSETYHSSVDALTNYINATNEWKTALGNAGIDADGFIQKLSDMGVSTDTLAQIMATKGQEGIDALISAYQNGEPDLYQTAMNLAGKTEEGLSSADTRTTGKQEASEFASGVGSGESETKAAAEKNASAAESGLKSKNDYASVWGHDLVSLFAGGIGSAVGTVAAAANKIAGTVESILGHSVPKEGILNNGGQGEKPWGRHLVQNIAEGMLEGKQDAVDAADEIARDISDELLSEFASIGAMGQIEASIGKGMSAVNLIAQSGGISNSETTWNINQPIATVDELMREQRLREHYELAGSR